MLPVRIVSSPLLGVTRLHWKGLEVSGCSTYASTPVALSQSGAAGADVGIEPMHGGSWGICEYPNMSETWSRPRFRCSPNG